MSVSTGFDHRYPANWTEARRALRCTRGSRLVELDSRVTPRGEYRVGLTYDVTGPSADGEVLSVKVWGGMLPLRILGGNVAVVLGSPWGNVAEVAPGARESTSVKVAPGCKASVYGADPARVDGSARTFLWDGPR